MVMCGLSLIHGKIDNPWTLDNYNIFMKNIAKWIAKSIQWIVIFILPTNLYAQEIVSKLQLSCEHSKYIGYINIGKYIFPGHITTSKKFEDSMETSMSFQVYNEIVFNSLI